MTPSEKSRRYRERKRAAASAEAAGQPLPPATVALPMAWVDGSVMPPPLTEQEALSILAKNAREVDPVVSNVAAKAALAHRIARERLELTKAQARAKAVAAKDQPYDFCLDDDDDRQEAANQETDDEPKQ